MIVRLLGAAALVAVMGFGAGVGYAEADHDLATMKGDLGIDLHVFDHAMAGSLRGFVIWGSVNEQTGASELIMRRDGQDVKSIFKKTGNVFGGVVQHDAETGTISTDIAFVGLNRETNVYSFTVNGKSVTAEVMAEDFVSNHFIKPTYKLTMPDGKSVSFKFDGKACYNYSLHIITMMIAAVTH